MLRTPPRAAALAPALAVVAALAVAPPPAVAQSARAPKAEDKTLVTRDGVELKVTYFPSSAGQDAAPVVMLHDYKDTRRGLRAFAERLSRPAEGDTHKPFAVLTVDLRGHGDSLRQTLGGRSRELDASRLKLPDMQQMVLADMEAVRKFLVTENDGRKLNLNRLSIVGVGLGASVALNWAAIDWAAPPLAQVKQGQDVKALALVSPRWKTQGLAVQQALRQPALTSRVALMLLYGAEDRRVSKDADRIFRAFEQARPKASPADGAAMASLLKVGAETELQGANWLKQAGPRGEGLILRFLTQHAATREGCEWTARRQP